MNMAVDATSRWRVHPTKRFARVGDFVVVWFDRVFFSIGLQVELSLFVEDGQALEAELQNEFSVNMICLQNSRCMSVSQVFPSKDWCHPFQCYCSTGSWRGQQSDILLVEDILHQLICSLSHYLQGFMIHPRWLFGISSINSMSIYFPTAASPGSRTSLHGDLSTIKAVWWC